MNKIIYKHELKKKTAVPVSADSEVLEVHEQGGKPFIWILENEETVQNVTITRNFLVVATGESIDPALSLNYVGTCHGVSGWMVLHVFEII